MHADDARIDALVALLSSLIGRIETRRVSGAVGLFLRGVQFGIVSGGKLFYCTDRLNRAAYEHASRLEDEERDMTMNFCPRQDVPADLPWRAVPAFVLDQPEVLRDWTMKAWEAAKRSAKSGRGGGR